MKVEIIGEPSQIEAFLKQHNITMKQLERFAKKMIKEHPGEKYGNGDTVYTFDNTGTIYKHKVLGVAKNNQYILTGRLYTLIDECDIYKLKREAAIEMIKRGIRVK